MRWKQKQAVSDVRIRSGFLFFPRCCGNQWRWLERATWEQKLHVGYCGHEWENVRWIDPVKPKTGYGGLWSSDVPPGTIDRDKVWYDTRDGVFRIWNGSHWEIVKK